MKAFPLLLLSFYLYACTNNKKEETLPVATATTTTNGVDIIASDTISHMFMLPDSINAGLIIATYVEIDPESHTIIMYANDRKREARLVRYLNDGTSTSDKLNVVADTLFTSPLNGDKYFVNDSMVNFKAINNAHKEHFRTDAHN